MGKRISNIKCNTLQVFRSTDLRGKEHGKYFGTFYGAGIIGTGSIGAPMKWQYSMNGDIITEYHVDLTGLACKGDAANDVIGLAAGGAAYLDQYVESTHGIAYRCEAICVEAPGEGTATITADIDIAFNTSAALAYDGAAGTAEVALGTHVKGGVFVDEALGLTSTDYMYLVEGDTAATTGVYNAGMLIIRLYGHPVLS
jgi:hypothetical protein